MNKLRRHLRFAVTRQEGFSVVESAVAIFLLTVGLLSTATVLTTVAGNQKVSLHFTTATTLAEEKIEALRHVHYDEVETSSEDFGEITDHISFRREVMVTPNAADTLKTLEVTVRHLGGQYVDFVTMIAR